MGELYEDMFELAPVSLWLEDYSALKQLFEAWRAEGACATCVSTWKAIRSAPRSALPRSVCCA